MLEPTELRARRAVLKVSQAEFANMLGISRQYLNRLETGKAKPSLKLQARYRQLFPEPLVKVTFGIPLKCPRCGERETERITDSDDASYEIHQCEVCGAPFLRGHANGTIPYWPITRQKSRIVQIHELLARLENLLAKLE